MGRVYNVVDTLVFVLCLPFYAIFVPILLIEQWLRQKRRVRLGLEVTHWPARDVREDYLVVDVSRMDEGLVGIRRRLFSPLWKRGSPPPYDEEIVYIRRERFWVPEPFSMRGK